MHSGLDTAESLLSRPPPVPIHKLPSELLGHIFLLVIHLQSELDWSGYPEIVSHVCSRWRKISRNFPSMWRFIELPLSNYVHAARVKRAVLFASIFPTSPLDVRLHRLYDTRKPNFQIVELNHSSALFGAIAPRIRSLDVAYVAANELIDNYPGSLLASTLMQSISLKTLAISHLDEPMVFFDTNRSSGLPQYMSRNYRAISTGNLDQALSSLTILRARGTYPMWTSKAYYGLIELRLTRGGVGLRPFNVSISEDHLQAILTASPALRVLELAVKIVKMLPENAAVVPIRLDHLQSLNVNRMAFDQLGTLLRWLAPGPKPLQLAIPNDDIISNEFLPYLTGLEARSFFARSNVAEIYARQLSYSGFFAILELCPGLKTLAWELFDFLKSRIQYPVQPEHLVLPPSLETLLILQCYFGNTAFPELIGRSLTVTQKVLFWKCKYYPNSRPSCVPMREDHLEHMVDLCPEVKIVDKDPTHDWEVFCPGW